MQFDDIGSRGTKVIIYNLWLNDDGIVELDFDTDPEVETPFSVSLYPFFFLSLISLINLMLLFLVNFYRAWIVGYSYWWGYKKS